MSTAPPRWGEAFGFALLTGGHVDGVDAEAVAGVGEAQLQFAGVVLGLSHPFGEGCGVGLGLHDRQLGVAVGEHVVGRERLASTTTAFDAAGSNRKLTPDAVAVHHAPTGCREQRIDQFGAGFGLVHGISKAT